jgi:hypothetical protein
MENAATISCDSSAVTSCEVRARRERVRNARGGVRIGRRVVETGERRRAAAEQRCSRGSALKVARGKRCCESRPREAHGSARERRRVLRGASRAGRTLMTLSWNASSRASSVVLTFTNGFSTVSSTSAASMSPVTSSSRRHEAAPSMVPARAPDAPKPRSPRGVRSPAPKKGETGHARFPLPRATSYGRQRRARTERKSRQVLRVAFLLRLFFMTGRSLTSTRQNAAH